MPEVNKISELKQAYANPRQGDVIYFDSETILNLSPSEKDQLLADLKWLAEIGIKVVTVSDQLEALKDVAENITILANGANGSTHTVTNYCEKLANKPKRIVMVSQPETVNSKLPIVFYQYVPLKQQQLYSEANENIPNDLTRYGQATSLGGGTNSTFKISVNDDASASPLVFKFGANQEAIKLEILTNVIYQFLGVNIPAGAAFNQIPKPLADALKINEHGLYQVSEFIIARDHPNEADIIKTAQKDFIIHALLGNIDVTKFDNFIQDPSGKVYLIDSGSNYLFRALGESREEAANIVTEVDSLRSKDLTKAAWFGSVNDTIIKEQVAALIAKEDGLERLVWETAAKLQLPENLRIDFLNLLSSRLDDLALRFCPEVPRYAKLDRQLPPQQTAAGVLTYTVKDNETYVLLAKRVDHRASEHVRQTVGLWDCFGGGTETIKGDIYLHNTAARESFEESSNQLLHSPGALLNCPFHDIITEKNGKPFIYRMYLREHDYVDPKQFTDSEHTDYRWVKASALNASLNQASFTDAKGLQTVNVSHGRDKLALYPEFYQLLKQDNVKDQLGRLAKGDRVRSTHTQSEARSAANAKKPQRHFHSPEELVWQTKRTVLSHLQVISELKATFKQKNDAPTRNTKKAEKTEKAQEAQEVVSEKSANFECQTELYMRVALGKKYIKNNPEANVRKMLDMSLPGFGLKEEQLTANQKENLVKQCIKWIEIERQGNPNQLYMYHGVDDKIAFVYDVYSAIHQLLQMNDERRVFRLTNEYFKPFMNIQAFMTYFTDMGGQIHNNKDNYNETAISVNWSLFGNWTLISSNSIYFMLSNYTAREVELEKLLQRVVSACGVPNTLVKPLLAVYEEHYKTHKNPRGTLYQLALPAEVINSLSYAAVPGGHVWPYMVTDTAHKKEHETFQPGELLSLLKADLDSGDSKRINKAKNYLLKLQARLMVPPHETINVTQMTAHDLDETTAPKTIADFPSLIGDIVYNMLLHQTDDTFHANIPANKLLAYGLEKNSLPKKQVVSEFTIKQAIVNKQIDLLEQHLKSNPKLADFAIIQCVSQDEYTMVKRIVELFPELKTKTLTGIQSYIGTNSILPMTLLKLIVSQGINKNRLLTVCFGDDWMYQAPLFYDCVNQGWQFDSIYNANVHLFNEKQKADIFEYFFKNNSQLLPEPVIFSKFIFIDEQFQMNLYKRYVDALPEKLTASRYEGIQALIDALISKDAKEELIRYVLAKPGVDDIVIAAVKNWAKKNIIEAKIVDSILNINDPSNIKQLVASDPELLQRLFPLDYFDPRSTRLRIFDLILMRVNPKPMLQAVYGEKDWINNLSEKDLLDFFKKKVTNNDIDEILKYSSPERCKLLIKHYPETIRHYIKTQSHVYLSPALGPHITILAEHFQKEIRQIYNDDIASVSQLFTATSANNYKVIFAILGDKINQILHDEGWFESLLKRNLNVRALIAEFENISPESFISPRYYIYAIRNEPTFPGRLALYEFYKDKLLAKIKSLEDYHLLSQCFHLQINITVNTPPINIASWSQSARPGDVLLTYTKGVGWQLYLERGIQAKQVVNMQWHDWDRKTFTDFTSEQLSSINRGELIKARGTEFSKQFLINEIIKFNLLDLRSDKMDELDKDWASQLSLFLRYQELPRLKEVVSAAAYNNFLREQLPKLIKSYYDLWDVFKSLSTEECKALCDNLSESWSIVLPNTASLLKTILLLTDEEKCEILCQACADYVFKDRTSIQEMLMVFEDLVNKIGNIDRGRSVLSKDSRLRLIHKHNIVFESAKPYLINLINSSSDHDAITKYLVKPQIMALQIEMAAYVKKFKEVYEKLPDTAPMTDPQQRSNTSAQFQPVDLMERLENAAGVLDQFYLIKKEITSPNSKAANALALMQENEMVATHRLAGRS